MACQPFVLILKNRIFLTALKWPVVFFVHLHDLSLCCECIFSVNYSTKLQQVVFHSFGAGWRRSEFWQLDELD